LFLETLQAFILVIQYAGTFFQRLFALFNATFAFLYFLPFGSDIRFCSGSGPYSFFFGFEQYFLAACVSPANLLFSRYPGGFLPPGCEYAPQINQNSCENADQ